MTTYALDFESYYDKDCSITTLGPRGYFSHPDFEAYLMSIVGDDGYTFCGDPRTYTEWSRLEGNVVLSHNASFDQSLYFFGVEKGWWPKVDFAEWHCTADLAAYCGYPRSLKGVSAALFDLEVSKDTRNSMMGRKWADMTPEFQREVIDYALKDSVLCLDIWKEIGEDWPEHEREVSRANRAALQRGLPVDSDYLRHALETTAVQLFESEKRIPWLGTNKLLSRSAFNEECRKVGLEPPKSLAMDNEEANEWMRIHSQTYRWVGAVRDWRRINALRSKLQSFDNGTMPDGRYYGNLMYFGAETTGRFSGSGGNLNLQNLTKDELYGVKMRSLFRAPKGRILGVFDLSQIEVRTLCWLAGDTDMLGEIADHDDIYEAFAIKYGWWTAEQGGLKANNPGLRNDMVKPTTLGCGYQAGAERLSEAENMPLEDALNAVTTYRAAMPKVVNLWKHYQNMLRYCYANKKPLAIRLPSGRVINYGEIKMRRVLRTVAEKQEDGSTKMVSRFTDEFFSIQIRQGRRVPCRLYGGLIVENLSQALARDIFATSLVAIDKAGYDLLFHVHDEAVIELDAATAEGDRDHILTLMTTPPDWLPEIPLASEGNLVEVYTK